MRESDFKNIKAGDWVLIESLCYGLSKNKDGSLSGDTGPWLSEVKAIGPNFIEYAHYLTKESNHTACGVGYATRRQIVGKVHHKDRSVIK